MYFYLKEILTLNGLTKTFLLPYNYESITRAKNLHVLKNIYYKIMY